MGAYIKMPRYQMRVRRRSDLDLRGRPANLFREANARVRVGSVECGWIYFSLFCAHMRLELV